MLELLDWSGVGEVLEASRSEVLPLGVALGVASGSAMVDEALLLVELAPGEVISMGSPCAGGDILMVGVGIGTMRAPIDSLLGKVERGRLSVLTAMCAVAMVVSQGGSRRVKDGRESEGGESWRWRQEGRHGGADNKVVRSMQRALGTVGTDQGGTAERGREGDRVGDVGGDG